MTHTGEVGRTDRSTAPARQGRGWTRFVRHYVEMLIAMIVGMFAFGPVWDLFATATGSTELFARTEIDAFVMATNMTVGMAFWMRRSGHGWRPVAEMGAAMFVPYIVLLVPYWIGLVSGDTVVMGGHVLMMPAMLVAMLFRREEYSQHHQPDDPSRSVGFVAAVARRWPSLLALLMTIDNWVNPSVPDPWVMMILPLAYLAIGGVRRSFGNWRMFWLQVAGLVGYLALVLVAVSVGDDIARYLVAAGWLAHGVWDVVHHRMNRVVPRAYAEWCAVVDTVIGVSILILL